MNSILKDKLVSCDTKKILRLLPVLTYVYENHTVSKGYLLMIKMVEITFLTMAIGVRIEGHDISEMPKMTETEKWALGVNYYVVEWIRDNLRQYGHNQGMDTNRMLK